MTAPSLISTLLAAATITSAVAIARDISFEGIVTTFPMTMKLVILSQVEFDRLTPIPGAVGFTRDEIDGCTIYLPAGYRISTQRNPPDKWEKYPARFIDPRVSHTLAHEIMHCLHGAWHD